MATKLYLPNGVAAPITPPAPVGSTTWEHINSSGNWLQAALLAPDSSALSTVEYAPDGVDDLTDRDSFHRQYVIGPLKAQTFAGNVTAQLQCVERLANCNLLLTMKIITCTAAGVLRNTLLAITRASAEANTSLRNLTFTSTALAGSQTCQDGDYLVLEIGLGGNITSGSGGAVGHDGSIRWGCNASSGDLPVDNTQVGTTYRGWVNFTTTIKFLSETTGTITASATATGVAQATFETPFPNENVEVVDDFTASNQTPAPGWTKLKGADSKIYNNQLTSVQQFPDDSLHYRPGTTYAKANGIDLVFTLGSLGTDPYWIECNLFQQPAAGTTDGYGVQYIFTTHVLSAYIITNEGYTLIGTSISAPTLTTGDQVGARFLDGGDILLFYKQGAGDWVFAGVRSDNTYTGDFYLGVNLDKDRETYQGVATDDISVGQITLGPTTIETTGTATGTATATGVTGKTAISVGTATAVAGGMGAAAVKLQTVGSSVAAAVATGLVAVILSATGTSPCAAGGSAVTASYHLVTGTSPSSATVLGETVYRQVLETVGTSPCAASATGVTQALALTTGTADGVATVLADGEAVIPSQVIETDGTSVGGSTATGITAAFALSTGTAPSVAGGSAITAAYALTTGTSTGVAVATGEMSSTGIIEATGTAPSLATVSGLMAAMIPSTGTSAGVADGVGEGAECRNEGQLVAQAATLVGSGLVELGAIVGTGVLAAVPAELEGAGLSRSSGSGVLAAAAAILLGSGATASLGTGSLMPAAGELTGVAASISIGSGSLAAQAAVLEAEALAASSGTGALHAALAHLQALAEGRSSGSGTLLAGRATVAGVQYLVVLVRIGGVAGSASTCLVLPGRLPTVAVGPGALPTIHDVSGVL